MTVTRAALYLGVASIVGVWLSSVASSMSQETRRAAIADTAIQTDLLPASLQEQSRRLRQRLAAGPPPPQQPARNPFAFTSERAVPRAAGAMSAPAPPPFEPFPPATADSELSLIGVAAHQRPAGPVHTAVLATVDGELIMAVTGDTVLDRFRVTAVAADSVELLEPATGVSVRLRLVP